MALVSIEQAVARALAVRLRSRLVDVTVFEHWPDPERELPEKAISILLAGKRQDTSLQVTQVGSENIHDELPTRALVPIPLDLPTSIVALNVIKSTWNAHDASTTVHRNADVTNVITAPDAFDLASAIFLANAIRPLIAPHVTSTVYHDVADSLSQVTKPLAFDLGSLVALALDLLAQVNKHYAARVYEWRIRVCDQPMQLDVWTRFHAVRDDLMAQLETELNVDATAERLDGPFSPVRNGILLDIADGWEGTVADIMFDAPMREDTVRSKSTSEYRATYAGTASFALIVKAQSARLARAVFRTSLHELDSLVGVTPLTTTLSYSTSGTPTISFT